MITYNWNFNPLTCQTHVNDHENVVVTVHWQFSGTTTTDDHGTVSEQFIGTQGFTLDPGQDTFIPFDELTKEIVQEWVETAMGEEYIDQMKQSIAMQIEDKIAPKIVNLPAPWIENTSF